MEKSGHFRIVYGPALEPHLRAVERKCHRLIREQIEAQLLHEPTVPTRNRKPMKGPTPWTLALWELRFGPGNRFRVFYEVETETRKVMIHAIGIKLRDVLMIGGEEVSL